MRPKPMVEIGTKPILWHIMKIYASYGISDFIVCAGFKADVIKEYFANYYLHSSSITVDLGSGAISYHRNSAEPWRVTVADTGENTQTGGRLKRVESYITADTFCMTYGDAVTDLDISAVLDFHRRHGKLATVTGVRPPGRFGSLKVDGSFVEEFVEKPDGDGGWINGGFFVLSKKAIDYIDGDQSVWEYEPMKQLAADRQLAFYPHGGFWQCMDTLRDKRVLDEMWDTNRAPWRRW